MTSPARTGPRRPDTTQQAGVTSLEFIGLLPVLLLVGAIMWQLLIFGGVASGVENAARDGSRVAGQGGDTPAVVAQVNASLPAWLDSSAVRVTRPGATAVEVTVDVPLLFPGITLTNMDLTRTADLPSTT